MTHENNEQQVESFETILHRFGLKLQNICAAPLRLNSFRNAPGVNHMRGGEEEVGAHIAMKEFQINTTPEGNICYIETFQSKTGIHVTVNYDFHTGSMTIDLYPPLGVAGRQTLILNSERVPQPVPYHGRERNEDEKIHAEHIAAIEEFFETHIFPWVESLGREFISGVVGLTSRQVRGATLAGNGGMEGADFEDPEGPYPSHT